jgi:two-component sensor histidine kinase
MRAAADRLSASEERARAILDAIPDLMFRLNRKGVLLDYKANQYDRPSAAAKVMVGGNVRDWLPPEIAAQVLGYAEATLQTRAIQQWEYQLQSREGPQDYESRMAPCGAGDVVAIIRNITAVKEADRAVRASLTEKEVLLHEIHHRVKNNLQVISSLINMQMRRREDAACRAALGDCQHRVQAVALIHETLYRSKSMARVPLRGYVNHLARDIFQSASVARTAVSLEVSVEDVALPVDQAVPCGLILNELITNALKHAFPSGQPGVVQIRLGRIAANRLRLVVADNGVGLPAQLDLKRCPSMGLQLVIMLAAQLHGDIEVSSHGGASFQISFPAAE